MQKMSKEQINTKIEILYIQIRQESNVTLKNIYKKQLQKLLKIS